MQLFLRHLWKMENMKREEGWQSAICKSLNYMQQKSRRSSAVAVTNMSCNSLNTWQCLREQQVVQRQKRRHRRKIWGEKEYGKREIEEIREGRRNENRENIESARQTAKLTADWFLLASKSDYFCSFCSPLHALHFIRYFAWNCHMYGRRHAF